VKRVFAIFLVFYSFPVCSYLLSSDFHVGVKKVIIDAGHGGRDPGNLGTGRYKTREKDVVLDVALQVGKYIEENLEGVEVLYTRTDDSYPELYERTSFANSEKADLFVSIHCDAFTNPQASGCSSFVVGTNHGKHSRIAIKENPTIKSEEDKINYGDFNISSPEYTIEVGLYQKLYEKNSLSLAEKIQRQFRERVNRKDRGVKREPLYVTSRVAMPSVLVELGFLTNPNEEDFLNSEQGKGYMASAIYRALKDYIHEQEGVIEDVKDIQQIIESDSTDSISTVEPQEDEIPEVTTFLSVQIMSSSIVLDQSKAPLSELSNCFYLQNTNLYKYFSGKYTNLEEVKIHQQKLVSQGFTDCFVVGVHNNAKVPISKALELLK